MSFFFYNFFLLISNLYNLKFCILTILNYSVQLYSIFTKLCSWYQKFPTSHPSLKETSYLPVSTSSYSLETTDLPSVSEFA